MYDRLIELVANDRLQEVLQVLLKDHAAVVEKEYFIRIVQLNAQFSELENKRKLKEQSQQQMNLELNQLRNALTELLFDFKKGEMDKVKKKVALLKSFPPPQLQYTDKQYQDIAEWLFENRVKTTQQIIKEINLIYPLNKELYRKLTYQFINAIILFSDIIGNNKLNLLDNPAFVLKFKQFHKEIYPKGLDCLIKQIPRSPRISNSSRVAIIERIEYFKDQLVSD